MNTANLVPIGAPLFTSLSAPGCWYDNCFIVERAFYLLCPFQESCCLKLYSFTDDTLGTFIADSVMLPAIRDHGSMFDASTS